MTSGSTYEYWREYPERDPQAVVWYPCTYGPLDPAQIWQGGPPAAGDGRRAEIGFYLHVPLCKGVCRYCPFNKYAWTEARAEQFVAAVEREIALVAARPYFEASQVVAGYLGGGTPTALGTKQLARVLECCHRHLNVALAAELTVEATPSTLDKEKLRMLRGLGVNRLSIGVQSFEPRLLRAMGRGDTGQRSLEAIELAHQIGFEVVTIDLLYRVPGQTLLDWERDLRQAVTLGLDHLTTFSLFVDPGTPLFDQAASGSMALPDEETELRMYRMAVEILGDAGYRLYTLYDFARPGKECLHHAINWQAPQRDYAGFGPGAFSFIRNSEASHIYCNLSDLDEYVDCVQGGRQPVEFGKRLTAEEAMSRYMVLGVNYLRVARAPFRERFGVDLVDVYGRQIEKLASWGLVEVSEDEMVLTEKGRIYVANVSKTFFTDENRGMPHVVGVELQKGEGLSLKGIAQAEGRGAP